MISQFSITIGAMLLSMAVVVAWLFKTSSAPTSVKISVSAILVALGCYAPIAANSIAGLPVLTSINNMPVCFEIVGMMARDDERIVDLWTIYKNGVPKSYEISLTKELRKSLSTIGESLSQNGTVHVCRDNQDAQHLGNPYGTANESSADGGIFIDPSFMLDTNKAGAQ